MLCNNCWLIHANHHARKRHVQVEMKFGVTSEMSSIVATIGFINAGWLAGGRMAGKRTHSLQDKEILLRYSLRPFNNAGVIRRPVRLA